MVVYLIEIGEGVEPKKKKKRKRRNVTEAKDSTVELEVLGPLWRL